MAKRPWWQHGLVFVGVLIVLYFSRTVLEQDRDPDGESGRKAARDEPRESNGEKSSPNTTAKTASGTPAARPTSTPPPAPVRSASGNEWKAIAERGDKIVEQAYRAKRSKVWVETVSEVIKLFRDDNVGSRHQLFLVKLGTGRTLKISHNIDLAPRVPVKVGDRVHIRGRYEYNDKGGVVHWTHHDPRNRNRGGWIKHRGKTYE